MLYNNNNNNNANDNADDNNRINRLTEQTI